MDETRRPRTSELRSEQGNRRRNTPRRAQQRIWAAQQRAKRHASKMPESEGKRMRRRREHAGDDDVAGLLAVATRVDGSSAGDDVPSW